MGGCSCGACAGLYWHPAAESPVLLCWVLVAVRAVVSATLVGLPPALPRRWSSTTPLSCPPPRCTSRCAAWRAARGAQRPQRWPPPACCCPWPLLWTSSCCLGPRWVHACGLGWHTAGWLQASCAMFACQGSHESRLGRDSKMWGSCQQQLPRLMPHGCMSKHAVVATAAATVKASSMVSVDLSFHTTSMLASDQR